MEEALYTFEPNLADTSSTLWLGVLAAVAGLAGCLFLLRKAGSGENRNHYLLGALLFFFVFLIGMSTAFFSWWTQRKIGPVKIYADAITTPYGTAEFAKIENAYIKEERRPSLINPNITRERYKLLIIEETDGKVHALSEENYDLTDIFQKLRDAIKKSEVGKRKSESGGQR
jgi:hypothetical protein